MNYLELLRLAAPEAILVVTALVVLTIGLVTGRGIGARVGRGPAWPAFAAAASLASARSWPRSGWQSPRPSSLGCRKQAMLFQRHARRLAAQFALQDHLPGAGLFHRPARARRALAAQPRRISRPHPARHDRAPPSRRKRGIAHDFHRARADRAVALCPGRVRQGGATLGRGRLEIFSLRQHGERVHAFRAQLCLWPDRNDRARRRSGNA